MFISKIQQQPEYLEHEAVCGGVKLFVLMSSVQF